MAVLGKGRKLRSIVWGEHSATEGLGGVIEIELDDLPGPMGDYLVAVIKFEGIRCIVPLHQTLSFQVVP